MTAIEQAKDIDTSATSQRLHGRELRILTVLCAAMFLDALDVSMMAVAIPPIQRSLHMSTSALQAVVSGYVLGYGGFLLLAGRAADVWGRRRVFLIALAGFAVMSAVGGVATGGALLIISRFVKGATAGFTAPAGLAIILSSFEEGHGRHKALAVYSATGAAGFTFGLIAGGLLTDLSWRLVFFMPSVVALVTLIAALRVIPSDPAGEHVREPLDAPGAVSATSAMLLLVYTLTEAPSAGWASARTLGSLAAVAALLFAFVLIERRQRHPLVRLGMLAHWPRVRANLGIMVFVGGWASTQFIATLYMQELRHWSALQTAVAFWPCGVLGLFVVPRLSALIARFGLLRLLSVGLVLTVVAYALFLRIDASSEYWLVLFPTFALIGVAFGLCFSTLNIAATDGVLPGEHGVASSLFQTSAQFGTALLLALATAVTESATHLNTSGEMLHAYRLGLIVPLAASAAIVVLTGLAAVKRAPVDSAA
jgi:predicted MFS family arabinose efflux permease